MNSFNIIRPISEILLKNKVAESIIVKIIIKKTLYSLNVLSSYLCIRIFDFFCFQLWGSQKSSGSDQDARSGVLHPRGEPNGAGMHHHPLQDTKYWCVGVSSEISTQAFSSSVQEASHLGMKMPFWNVMSQSLADRKWITCSAGEVMVHITWLSVTVLCHQDSWIYSFCSVSGSIQSWAAGTSWRQTTTTGRSHFSWMTAGLPPWNAWTRSRRRWVQTSTGFISLTLNRFCFNLWNQLPIPLLQNITLSTLYDMLSTKPVLNKASLSFRIRTFYYIEIVL